MKAYHSSTAYQQYLSAKSRAKANDKSNTVGGVIAVSDKCRRHMVQNIEEPRPVNVFAATPLTFKKQISVIPNDKHCRFLFGLKIYTYFCYSHTICSSGPAIRGTRIMVGGYVSK
ncbi:unnamed protein product [Gongylonema pulchrum]|uniref:Uncharacterized protein n=1 Tax=Gongylonema pulchrum TaxID=637853 RepID=A0A3P7ME78_9BILA|nr:unnamed protein product [Gongylonema pulchrum]